MEYEAYQDRGLIDVWNVEAINHEGDGEIYVASFSGPNAKERAKEYAAWKSKSKQDCDLETLERAADLGVPSMSPQQLEAYEGLLGYLKERIKCRKTTGAIV